MPKWRATPASSVCSPGGSGSSDITSSTVAPAMRREAASAVSTTMSSRQGVVQAARGPGAPSTPTMHTRHAPKGSMRSSKQRVGT